MTSTVSAKAQLISALLSALFAGPAAAGSVLIHEAGWMKFGCVDGPVMEIRRAPVGIVGRRIVEANRRESH